MQKGTMMAASSDSEPTAAGPTSTASRLAKPVNIGSLQDKIALVTGASSGLGRAIAQAYAGAGAYVVIADLRAEPPPVGRLAADEKFKDVDFTTPTAELIESHFPREAESKPRAAFIQCDVTDPASVEAAVAFTVETYGRLDIMVNNAGISSEAKQRKRLHEQDVSTIDKDVAVNVKGTWLGCKYAIGQMLAQPASESGERGWIINMCSIAGLVGLRGSASYCATKGAVLQMTKSIALDYAADQIHVNCINPAFVQTSLLEVLRDDDDKVMKGLAKSHPWGRLAVPDDIAKMAVFLAGEGASFVTGAAFVVDGGYTAQ